MSSALLVFAMTVMNSPPCQENTNTQNQMPVEFIQHKQHAAQMFVTRCLSFCGTKISKLKYL